MVVGIDLEGEKHGAALAGPLVAFQPHQLFENRAFDLLMEAETWEDPPFVYRDSAGNRQLLRQSEEVTAQTVLERYYASARDRVLT